MSTRKSRSSPAVVSLISLAFGNASYATWSICIADNNTKQIALGTVTCVQNLDLLALLPVVVVGKGVGAAQAQADTSGVRRLVIFNGLMAGTDPAVILADLVDPSHDGFYLFRQYGIVDTQGRAVTYTGANTLQWSGGLTGPQGTMYYAIQGNILSGSCVVPAIEQAILNTIGDVPAKLMAGMQAARQAGGDGRCSCPGGTAPCAPCPPSSFTKSGHIGGMIVARVGDTDDSVCNAQGCADGNYFMRLNVRNQVVADPDPVDQLQILYDTWRAALAGRPDAVQSTADMSTDTLSPKEPDTATLTITLRDINGGPVTATIQSVQVVHAPGSTGSSPIGPVVDNGDDTYTVVIGPPSTFGLDRFRITVNDGIRPVVLMPDPTLLYPATPLPAISYGGFGLAATLVLAAAGFIFTKRLFRTP